MGIVSLVPTGEGTNKQWSAVSNAIADVAIWDDSDYIYAPEIEAWADAFPAMTDWTQDPHNGTITPVSDTVILNVALGQDAKWNNASYNAPMIRFAFADLGLSTTSTHLRLQATLQMSEGGGYDRGGFCLFEDDQNFIGAGLIYSTGSCGREQAVNNVFAEAGWQSYAGGAAITILLEWNNGASAVTTKAGDALAAGEVAIYASDDGGATWDILQAAEACPVTPSAFGAYIHNSNAGLSLVEATVYDVTVEAPQLSLAGTHHEYTFDAPVIPTDNMIMAVRVVAVALSSVSGDQLKLTVRRPSGNRPVAQLPFSEAYQVSESYTEYAITLCGKPFPNIQAQADAWTAAAVNDYEYGVISGAGTGTLRVTQFRLDVIYRPTVTLDEILSDERSRPFQWVEIEGIRWVPTDKAPLHPNDWSVGAYYFGLDYRAVSGLLSSNQKFRSGRVNHVKGREEFETARMVLQDEQLVAYEGDVNGDGPVFTHKRNGFFSWLLSYGDRTNVANTRMTSSTGAGYNSLEGLDPKGWSGSYGRRFTVGDSSDFPAAAGEDSYLYTGKETIWYGQENDGGGFGDATDANDLERGCFGSMNAPHEYNRLTGIYPEVTDKPVSWNGRWVRWWINAIDPLTGYPFPKSLAKARTYLWASHEQVVGPTAVRYEVGLSAFDGVLDGRIPSTSQARVKGLNLKKGVLVVAAVGATYLNAAYEYLQWPASYFASLDDFLNDATDGLNAKFNGLFDPSMKVTMDATVKGANIEITARVAGHFVYLRMDQTIGQILGYDYDEQISPDNLDVVSDPPLFSEEQRYLGKDAPADVFVDRNALKVYVEDNDTDPWPSIGIITGSTDQILAVVESGSDDREIYRFQATSAAVGTDADGDYITVVPTPPKWWASMLGAAYKRCNILASGGSGEVKVTLALATDKLRAHEFFLRALLSTGFGFNGASYDIWPKGFGLGINLNLINWQSIKNISEQLKMWRVYSLLEPEKLSEYLDEELQFPNGIVLRQDDEGKIQWQLQALPLASDTVPSINDDDWSRTAAAKCSHSDRNIVNRYVFEIDYNPLEDKYASKIDAREPNSIERYGDKSVEGKHRGVRTDIVGTQVSSAGNPFAYFPNLCQVRFQRFGFEMATISGSINMRGLALGPGDAVRLTHSLLQDTYDDASIAGISNRACEIQKIDKDDVRGTCEIEAMYDGISRRFGGYAPAVVINAWVGGVANIATVHPYELRNSAYDAALIPAGAVVSYYKSGYRNPVVNANLKVVSVATNGCSVSLNGVPHSNIVNGDVLVWAAYDDLTNAQKASGYVGIADSANGYVDTSNTVKAWDYSI